mmetsp:Transcript_10164/g.34544  ORF Transcript_10164/g.34544 Transcript_10164/m.34544 type:complete len:266 (+) Transcript_10164:113-910(+)
MIVRGRAARSSGSAARSVRLRSERRQIVVARQPQGLPPSELHLGVLVHTGRDDLLALAAGDEGDLALDHHAGLERNLALRSPARPGHAASEELAPGRAARRGGLPHLDSELLAVQERGHGAEGLHGVHELVPAVELHVGRLALALGRELHAVVRGDHVRVRPEGEEVVGGLDGGEAGAWDDHGGGSREAGDGGAHGGLELEHLGGPLVARVDGLFVFDDRQRERAAVLVKERLEGHEVNPEVVGVEELVLFHVLELLLVLLGALR